MLQLRFSVALCAALLFAGGACARAAPPTGAAVDGIRCDRMEGNVFHIHAHLAIVQNGKDLPLPADLGHSLVGGCLYWIHTHGDDGIVHIESPVFRQFTLGQLFDVWGQQLGRTAAGPARARSPLHVWVNGRPYRGDPRAIDLNQHTVITVQAGPPYKQPPPFTAWNGN